MKRVRSLFGLVLVCGMLLGLCMISEAASAKLSTQTLSLIVGQKQTLSVKNAGTATVKWSSNNKKTATVTSEGEVTAKKPGTAKITAKVGSKKLKCAVTVLTNAPMLSQTELNITVGDTTKLIVINDNHKSVKWSSNKKKVVTVSAKGKVKAKKAGSAKITAKIGGKKLVCKVTVAEAPDEAVAQAVKSKTFSSAGMAFVKAGSKKGILYPSVRITNVSACLCNIWIDGFLVGFMVPPYYSIVRSISPNCGHRITVTDVWGIGGYKNIKANVGAVCFITNIT